VNRLAREGRRSRRGQSLVEMCLILPVMLLLFIGAYTASNFINDRQIAGQATRAGARLAAEDGNAGYGTGIALAPCQASATDPCQIDNEVLRSTLTVARGFSNVSGISEVDIYQPCSSGSSCGGSSTNCSPYTTGVDGSLQSGDPVDIYKPNGGGTFVLSNAPAQYTLDKRNQTHPNESLVGVRIVYTFQGSAPMTFFNFQTSEYATMCLAPKQSGG
jgi:Flp pilus assembly protein TadG